MRAETVSMSQILLPGMNNFCEATCLEMSSKVTGTTKDGRAAYRIEGGKMSF